VVLAELKPTPNRTNLAAQSKCIYDSRSNKNKKTKQNKTAMIVSRVASESIRNMNETEDTNKNINKICKNDETAPKYVGYVEEILQEMKITKRKRILKVIAKQTRLRQVKSESGI
jgi:hypothetical protein